MTASDLCSIGFMRVVEIYHMDLNKVHKVLINKYYQWHFCLTDTDECANSLCEHGCINTDGGYQCMCNTGYTLEGLHECAGKYSERVLRVSFSLILLFFFFF